CISAGSSRRRPATATRLRRMVRSRSKPANLTPAGANGNGRSLPVPVLRVLRRPAIFRRPFATCDPLPTTVAFTLPRAGVPIEAGDPRTADMEHEYIDRPDRLARVVQRLAGETLLGV